MDAHGQREIPGKLLIGCDKVEIAVDRLWEAEPGWKLPLQESRDREVGQLPDPGRRPIWR